MAISIKARILLGFGIILLMLIVSAAVSSRLIGGIDTHFDEFRLALDRRTQAETIDLVMQQTRVRVNQWLRSLNPAFAKQADELLDQSITLLDKAKASAATDKERQIVATINTALTAYIKSWHVIQDLYAQSAKVYAEKIDAPGARLRADLAKLRDAEADAGGVKTSGQITEARDGFIEASAAAAHFQATLSKDDAAKIETAIAAAHAALAKAASALEVPADADAVKAVGAAVDAWHTAFGEATKLAATRLARLDSWTKDEGEVMATGANALRAEGQTAATAAQSAVEETIGQSHETLYLSVGIILAAGIVLSLLLARSLTGPLARVTAALQALAAGDRAVMVPETGRRDEIGAMAKTAQVFKDNALAMERMRGENIEQKERTDTERRGAILGMAADFEKTVGAIIATVSASASELEASATTLTQTADTTQKLSTTVASASEEASSNVQSVAAATEQMAASVTEIGRQVHESNRIASEAVGQAQKTDERITKLAQAAARIGDVTQLITSIAEQTNLLALNATFEAARAGASGKGFAVVAQEVKQLAAQTAKATSEIATQIAEMQSATQDSVAAIKEIGGTIGRISEIATTIASAIEEQGAATQEITRNVQHAAASTSEVAANITAVNRGASDTGSASAQVLSSAKSLSNESHQLRSAVGRFLATVRAA